MSRGTRTIQIFLTGAVLLFFGARLWYTITEPTSKMALLLNEGLVSLLALALMAGVVSTVCFVFVIKDFRYIQSWQFAIALVGGLGYVIAMAMAGGDTAGIAVMDLGSSTLFVGIPLATVLYFFLTGIISVKERSTN